MKGLAEAMDSTHAHTKTTTVMRARIGGKSLFEA